MPDAIPRLADLVEDGTLEIGAGRPRTAGAELPVLRVADVLDGRIRVTGQGSGTADARQSLGPKVSRAGDIVLTTKGTVGRVAIMPNDGSAFAYSPQICYFRPVAHGKLDFRYLYYWLKSPDFITQAIPLKSQTDMADFISLQDLFSIRVQLPAPGVQRAIVEVLGALDDKIAVNAKLVATADDLAKLRFESTLGTACRPLSSLARFVNGKAFTKGASETGRVVIRIAELNSGIGGSTVFNDLNVVDDHLARPGDLLFAWSGSLTVRRWFRPEGIINQHIFKVIPADVPMWVVKGALDRKLREFQAIAADKATTMGHIQRRHLDEEVQVPTEQAITSHHAAMTALWDRALAAEQESLQLTEMRDALLPQLMSGTLTVKDAESVLEGVV